MNISSLTSRMRYGLVVLAVAIAIITVFLFFHFNQSELNEDSPHGNDMSMDKTGHGNQEQIIEGNLELAHSSQTEKSTESQNMLFVSPKRLQSIGVTFELAKRQAVDHVIRTVGRVEVDEKLLSRVTIKLEGWVDQLFVNFTGEHVKQGQKLFTLYSPQLLATQEEYLISLQSSQTLGKSEFPEVAQGARALLEASREKLRLLKMTDGQIAKIEHSRSISPLINITGAIHTGLISTGFLTINCTKRCLNAPIREPLRAGSSNTATTAARAVSPSALSRIRAVKRRPRYTPTRRSEPSRAT